MIVVHHLNNSRSQRILWLLEELGLNYEIKRYERNALTMLAPPELKRVHPLGKAPLLTEGAYTLAETGAIVEYILDRHGEGRLVPPAGTREKYRWTYWLHYAEGSAMPPLLLQLIFSHLPKAPDVPWLVRPLVRAISAKALSSFVQPQLKTHFDFIESELGRSEWFAGADFSAADIQMSFPMEAAQARGVLDPSRSACSLRFLERIHARPAYQKALIKGGPYDLLS